MQILTILELFLLVIFQGCLCDDKCFGEGQLWRQLTIATKSKWFIMNGQNGICFAAYSGHEDSERTFQIAAEICKSTFQGGQLLTNDSWNNFKDTWAKYPTAHRGYKVYVNFTPIAYASCYTVHLRTILNVEYVAYRCPYNKGYLCEYPWRNSCHWEMTTHYHEMKNFPKKYNFTTRLTQFQEADGYVSSCKPDEFETTVTFITFPEFEKEWSALSECTKSCNANARDTSSRMQFRELTAQCKNLEKGSDSSTTRLQHLQYCDLSHLKCPPPITSNSVATFFHKMSVIYFVCMFITANFQF